MPREMVSYILNQLEKRTVYPPQKYNYSHLSAWMDGYEQCRQDVISILWNCLPERSDDNK